MIKYLGFTIIVPLAASQTLHAQTKEPPGVPYFKIEGDADKVAPAFNWWFELNPQPEYDRWWHEIAACEKLPLPDTYKKVRWFAINAKVFAPPNEKGDTTEILPTAVAYTWRWGPEFVVDTTAPSPRMARQTRDASPPHVLGGRAARSPA
jgi:hypothetical protein